MTVDFLFEPITDVALSSAPGVLSTTGGFVSDTVASNCERLMAFAQERPVAAFFAITAVVFVTTVGVLGLAHVAKPATKTLIRKSRNQLLVLAEMAADALDTNSTVRAEFIEHDAHAV